MEFIEVIPTQNDRNPTSELEILRAVIQTQKDIWDTEAGWNDLIQIILERMQYLTRASGAAIAFHENGELVNRATCGSAKDGLGLRVKLESSLSGQSFLSGQTLYCSDMNKDSRVDREACKVVGLRSLVVTPFWQKNKMAGVLEVISPKPNAFTEMEIKTLELMAGFIGAALNRTEEEEARAAILKENNEIMQALRHREELLRKFIFHTPVPIAMCDRDMRYIMTSQSWLRACNLTEQEIVGRSHYELFNVDEDRKALQQRVLAGEVLKCDEDTYRCKNGNIIWYRWEMHPWYDATGSVGGITMFTEVITRQKRAEEKLRRSNEELAQFAALASHDLQEPIRVIGGYLQLLKECPSVTADPTATQYMDLALENSVRLCQMVSGILAYSKLGDSDDDKQGCDAGEVLTKTLGTLELLIRESGALVIHGPLPRVRLNGMRLSTLFQNMITNAIKFRGENSPQIDISCELVGDDAIFSVKDNGIGIDAKNREKIFQMFQRVHSRNTYPGIGLGLACCKKIVDQAGGKIWVESEPGKGSTFRFSLRIARPVEA